MDFSQSGKELAKLELQSGTKAVAIIKDALISITSDDQQESFLDSYLNFRINNGEDEKEAKNYRSRVKAILKNWKEDEKRNLLYSHPSKSVQLLAKYARELNKKPKDETEESADESVTTETLLSLGDISAELDRLAQHLQHHGKFEAVEKLLVISTEILETEEEPATM
jgi:hypothetical protein